MGKDRKNTLVLTVVSIATLLVAVVGATFAYFTASVGGDTQNVVTVTTSGTSSIFTAYSTPLTLDVTIEDMYETAGNDDYSVYKSSESSASIEAQKVAGGTAVCTYDLIYTPDAEGVFSYSDGNVSVNKLKELTITGTASLEGAHAADATATSDSFEEFDLAGVTNKTTLISNGSFTLDATGDIEKTATLTWNFDVRFYNLGIDQSSNAEKSFSGVIGFENLDCQINE